MLPSQSLKRVGAALIALGSLVTAVAGPVTIEPKEIPALRDLVAKDSDAAAQYAEFKSVAEAALLTAPSPLVRVSSAGLLESDPDKVKTRKSLEDMQKVEALAWVSVVTGDAKYAAKGREFLLAWAKTNQPDGNAINESVFEPMIEAYDILREGFNVKDRGTVDGWLRGKVDPLWTDPRGQKENWQSHRLKIIGLIALTIRDNAMWAQVDKAYKEHLATNFNADGESIDFKRRDALHYHLYAVRPLLTLACASGRSGDNLFAYKAPNGASLAGAVDFVLPFANKSKKHVEFAESEVGFDKKRARSGEAEYRPHPWSPRSATVMFSEAACLNPAYGALASKVSEEGNKKYINWRSVLNAAAPAPQAK